MSICMACGEGEVVVKPIVSCTICGKEIPLGQVVPHYASHGKRSGGDVTCPVCGGKVRQSGFPAHLRGHFVVRRGRVHMCGICGRRFHSRRSVLVHLQRYHGSG